MTGFQWMDRLLGLQSSESGGRIYNLSSWLCRPNFMNPTWPPPQPITWYQSGKQLPFNQSLVTQTPSTIRGDYHLFCITTIGAANHRRVVNSKTALASVITYFIRRYTAVRVTCGAERFGMLSAGQQFCRVGLRICWARCLRWWSSENQSPRTSN